ncbi:MAG: ParB-like protein partition protein [Parcubacteria group bacterium GW2011_GWB1_42_9]|nr:MAG: ParB-like protein partition protein [Parcubacteria group bacterium GW2011_GWB1_42_9]
MPEDYNHSIFMIEVDKIKPNPYQPRQEFNEDRLRDLADSIRQYGVLQPLVVTRKEVEREDGLVAEYELIAGERRLRASKVAGLSLVPAIIRSGEHADKMKLEMAIVENLQREDLNPVDRALSFSRLSKEFNLTHEAIAKKVGKSRVYVTNTTRILALPQEMLEAIVAGKITEGHTRPLLMLIDKPEEQGSLFQEIMLKRLTVREAENLARRIAYERVRHRDTFLTPAVMEMEEKLTEKLGTRVRVEKKPGAQSGRVMIDFFTLQDLDKILVSINEGATNVGQVPVVGQEISELAESEMPSEPTEENIGIVAEEEKIDALESTTDPEDLYIVRNFSL